MSRRRTSLPPELEAFIEPRRVSRQLPAEARARVLARAGTAGATGEQMTAAYPRHRGDSRGPVRARWVARLAVAASVALAAGTVWGIVSLPHRPSGESSPSVRPSAVQTRTAGARKVEPPALLPVPVP